MTGGSVPYGQDTREVGRQAISFIQAAHHLVGSGHCAQRDGSCCLLLPIQSVYFAIGTDGTRYRHHISDSHKHFRFDAAREVNPVSVLVMLGIATSIVALFITGDPRLLLIRESLFTGAFGLLCLFSLLLPRPMMFYFGRYFMTGGDPKRRKLFEDRWQNPIVRRGHRLITVVWGLVYLGEFVLRVILVYTLAASIVLAVTPILLGLATIFTIIWTFRYAYALRDRGLS